MIGDVTAYGGQSVRELPSVLCDHYAVDYGGNVRSSALQLEDALSSFAENAVCAHHGGWENGEGAYGEIVIDVASGGVTITTNARSTEERSVGTECCRQSRARWSTDTSKKK